jgi:hypothetical protein
MAMTLAHLETRMHSARLLDSGAEYKLALQQYTKKIAEEGFKAKAEELVRELFGPMYWFVYAPHISKWLLNGTLGGQRTSHGLRLLLV